MEKTEIVYNKPEEAIAVMKEVAKWGREQGYRVWPDEWLTPDELITEEAKLLRWKSRRKYSLCINLTEE